MKKMPTAMCWGMCCITIFFTNDPQWIAGEYLAQSGVKPGDRVAVMTDLASATRFTWAYVDQLQIIGILGGSCWRRRRLISMFTGMRRRSGGSRFLLHSGRRGRGWCWLRRSLPMRLPMAGSRSLGRLIGLSILGRLMGMLHVERCGLAFKCFRDETINHNFVVSGLLRVS